MTPNKRAEMTHEEQPLYHMLRAALAMKGKPLAELSDEEYRQVEQQAYRELAIEQRALSTEEAAAVIIPDAVVEASVKEIMVRYEDEESFWTALENNGLSRTQLYRAVERDLRVQTVIQRITARGWQADDVEGEIFYHLHKERFIAPETRTLRHILITVNEEYKENSPEQVRARINAIYQRVKTKPKRFAELAQKHSECPTALHGGLLGQIKQGQLYPELDKVAFSLRAGGISTPVESELGLHLIYCESIHPRKKVAYKEVSHKIKEQLQQRYDRIWLRQWLKGSPG